MSLFTLPKRKDSDIHALVKKTKEPPRVKKNVNLSERLVEIDKDVKKSLGKEAEGFLCISDDKEFLAYCRQAQKDGIVAIDTETTGIDTMLDSLVGICLYSPSQKPAYCPVGHVSPITEKKMAGQISDEAIKKGFEMLTSCKCLFHNAYFDIIIVYNACGVMLETYWDTQIAGHLLNENESHSLKDLYAKYVLGGNVPATYFNDLFEGVPFCYIPPKTGMAYAAKDAKMTYELYKFQERFLTVGTPENKEYGLERLAKFHKEEILPMIPILVDMKLTGMEFDFDEAKKLKDKYEKLKADAVIAFNQSLEPFKEEILKHKLEYPLNYNSPPQIKILFYDIAKIGVVYRKEPTGTGKNVLEAILALDKFKNTPIRNVAKCISEVKQYDKVIGGFIDKLTEDARLHGGKIYPDLKLAGTVTGRLASANPNCQNIPSKMKDIRRMFTAGRDNYFVSCDFSKQEPCLLASSCKDHNLIEAFHSGLDIYSKIASMVFNVPYEDCLEHNPDGTTNQEGKDRRSTAKKITLALMYSKGLKALAEDLHSDISKAQEVMDAVFIAYPKMKEWIDDGIVFASKYGYIDNLFGRRRRWPEFTKPLYEFIFPKGTDENTIKYYSGIYLSKLKKAWFKDKLKIKQQIEAKGVTVIDNEAKIAEAKRQVANFQIQGCLHSDSVILTKEYGLCTIKEVVGKDITIWDGDNFVKASCIYSGKKQLVKIHLTNKQIIQCSLHHRFLFMDTKGNVRYKTAEELNSMTGNSKMLVRSNTVDDFTCLTENDFPNLVNTTAHNAHKYSFNVVDDEYELGYLLGWLHGDGSIKSEKGIDFLVAENKYAIKPFLESILQKYYKYSTRYYTVEEIQKQKKNLKVSQSQTRLGISSRTLAKQALDMGIKECVPKLIMKSKMAMRGYIQALFDTDGSASSGTAVFTFGKVHFYAQLACELQSMLMFFGITSRVHYCADRINVQVMKRDIGVYLKKIGSRHPDKLKKLKEIADYWSNNKYGSKYPQFAHTVRISSIEITDECVDMYDIVDSDSHKFVVNGIVTHNSAATVTMRAMYNIFYNQDLQKMGCKLVMSIHDENLITVPKHYIKEAVPIIEHCMISAGEGLLVPLSCDTEVSDRWYGEPVEVDKL